MTNKPITSRTSETLVLWMTYLLYLLFAPALVGFGINYFKEVIKYLIIPSFK